MYKTPLDVFDVSPQNKFEIIKYPTVSSVVKVETWPIKPKRFEFI